MKNFRQLLIERLAQAEEAILDAARYADYESETEQDEAVASQLCELYDQIRAEIDADMKAAGACRCCFGIGTVPQQKTCKICSNLGGHSEPCLWLDIGRKQLCKTCGGSGRTGARRAVRVFIAE